MTHDCEKRCVAGWQPGRKCHCTECGENFSSPPNFDKHRGSLGCTPPAKSGLILNPSTSVWHMPDPCL
jgi:hypothetical protein